MTSNRPYLVRALNEWILDNGLTPYLLVDADFPGTTVPAEFIQDGNIILNISPSAVKGLFINNDAVQFNARFSGKPMELYIPVSAVTAIYARENGMGMMFPEEMGVDREAVESENKSETQHRKPELRVIK